MHNQVLGGVNTLYKSCL